MNAILRGTETSGVSMFAAACHILGGAFEKCFAIQIRTNVRVQCQGLSGTVAPYRKDASELPVVGHMERFGAPRGKRTVP